MSWLKKRDLKSGYTWVYGYRDKTGRQHSISLRTSNKCVAKSLKRDLDDKLRDRKLGLNMQSSNPNLDNFWLKYKRWAYKRKNKLTVIREEAAFIPFRVNFGNIRISKISSETIEDYFTSRSDVLSATTCNIDLRSLKAVFSYAVRNKYVPENPFTGVQELFVKEPEYSKAMSMEEARILIDVIDDPFDRALVLMYLSTGARRQEVLNIKWKDISFEDDTIKIYRLKKRKNREDVLPLHPIVKKCLLGLSASSERVFNISSSCAYHRIKKYYAKAGLPKRYGIHTFRHTCLTEAARHAKNAFMLQKLAGHSNIRTTTGYVNTDMESQREINLELRYLNGKDRKKK